MFRKTPSRVREFKQYSTESAPPSLEVPFVGSTKQRKGLEAQKQAEEYLVYERAGYVVESEKASIPQVSGGGSIESGGDGTGWAGGVDVRYWEARIANLRELAAWIGHEPVEGRDYPSREQMNKARSFYRARRGFEVAPGEESVYASYDEGTAT
jgi:hypothetical protein